VPELLLSLVPLVIGSAVLPTWISLIVLLLRTPHGTAKALSFVAAVTAVRLLQGAGAGGLLRSARGVVHHLDGFSLRPAMFLVAGVLLVGMGAHGLLRGARSVDRPPRLYGPLREAGALKCAAAGTVLILASPRQWMLTLSAVDMIQHAGLGVMRDVLAYLAFTAGAVSLILAPILWALIKRDSAFSHPVLSRPRLRHGIRRLADIGSILIGAYFLWHGITGPSA
jgi:hypothetical protein